MVSDCKFDSLKRVKGGIGNCKTTRIVFEGEIAKKLGDHIFSTLLSSSWGSVLTSVKIPGIDTVDKFPKSPFYFLPGRCRSDGCELKEDNKRFKVNSGGGWYTALLDHEIGEGEIFSFKLKMVHISSTYDVYIGACNKDFEYAQSKSLGQHGSSWALRYVCGDAETLRGSDRVNESYGRTNYAIGDIVETIVDRGEGTISYKFYKEGQDVRDLGVGFRSDRIKNEAFWCGVTCYYQNTEVELVD